MPQSFSVVGLFSEDIREEKSGQDTIIGVLPDNFSVPQVPGMIIKLGVYVRLHFDVSATAQTLALRLQVPGAPDLVLGVPDNAVIGNALAEAKARNLPIAGVVVRAVISQFAVRDYGQIRAIAAVDGVDHVCAALNVIQATPTSATASAQPVLQSPTVP